MRLPLAPMVLALTLALAAALSSTARADITVVGHYTFVNGDTATRTSYYSRKRVRVTAPDGKEFIFDAHGKKVTIIDHAHRTYWTGPVAVADSLAGLRLAKARADLAPQIEARKDEYLKLMETFNQSIHSVQTGQSKTLCNYPVDEWVLSAPPYLESRRWLARGLSVPNYGPELEKVVLASIMDPMGRVMMRMLIDQRTNDGLPLASTVTFKTLTQSGSFSWEATSVSSAQIPKSVWDTTPDGYTRIKT